MLLMLVLLKLNRLGFAAIISYTRSRKSELSTQSQLFLQFSSHRASDILFGLNKVK